MTTKTVAEDRRRDDEGRDTKEPKPGQYLVCTAVHILQHTTDDFCCMQCSNHTLAVKGKSWNANVEVVFWQRLNIVTQFNAGVIETPVIGLSIVKYLCNSIILICATEKITHNINNNFNWAAETRNIIKQASINPKKWTN